MNNRSWKDCKAWRDAGLALSTSSDEAARMLDATITQFAGSVRDETIGGIENSIKRLKDADPTFVLGQCAVLGMELMCVATSYSEPDLKSRVDSLERMATKHDVNHREERHVKAVCEFGRGNWTAACVTWEDILLDHATDVLALKFCRDVYFYQGGLMDQRGLLIQTLKHWTEDMPTYSTFLGHRAFAYGEMQQLGVAEREARRALELCPGTNWARHALAHVLDAQGRHEEGRHMLGETRNIWTSPEQTFICHINWHHALFHLEQGDSESCLGIFDSEIFPYAQKYGETFSNADSSSLLMRLQMAGVDVGAERWENVVELYRPHRDDHVLAFHDAHMLMSLAHAPPQCKGEDVMDSAVASLKDFVSTSATYSAGVLREVCVPMGEAFASYHHGDYAAAVTSMFPVRYQVQRIGGSNAQRDLFQQFLIYCCSKSSDPRHRTLGRHLMVERRALRGGSPLLDRLESHFTAHHELS